ncbi:DUF3427 domain-containing protein [Staphylococcus pseudintermedius]|nr:DUF3427 domain-containing protein [Staphylococcus pseudintermedius]
MDHLLDDFKNSLHKGFIDRSIEKQGHFLPKLLINNAQENVLATIIDELYRCESFSISVAFVTESGLASLKTHLYELKLKGVRGRILTSNYLSFNSPKMYEELMKLENVDVRVTNVNGFHAKGYIFDHDYYTSMIVGSSNLTSHALKVNYEHNIMFSSHRNGDIVHKVKNQFEQLWEASEPLTASWIESYRKLYQPKTRQAIFEVEQAQIEKQRQLQSAQAIIPNMMQQEALRELEMIRQQGESRGLIISATGTGKTIMSALDVRQVQPEKFLFVVHNEGILRRAMEDYRRVLADEPADAFGLLTGNDKQTTAKYLFSTIQTISKPDIYEQFSREHFDYIVFDEAHRVAAASYRRVFNYFTPEFILGMTATPERNDTLNIFELFHYNIAYEIRLQAALENDILCPFHYFGVTDYEVDGIISDDTISLQKLASDARVQQLGRGLRKSSNKEYVTVIDFIGNYKNNYLIPIALSGDPSYHKDNYRQFLTNPAVLNGVSTINFEEVAKKQIFESLTKATLNSVKILDDAYENVARRIGRQPLLMDFNDQNAIDPLIILEKYKNYHEFLEKRGYTTEVLEPDAFKNLTFLSREVAPGLKNTEHFILQRLIEGDARIAELLEHMQQIDSAVTVADIETTLKILDFSYFKNDIEKSYGPPVIHRQGDVIELAAHFQHQLKNERFQRYVEDIIRLGQYNNEMKFEGQNEFIRYQKYFRKDFVKIMNWDKDVSSTIYGYQVRHHMVPIFVTYHKQEDITTSTQYGDTFISQSEFKWYTRSNRSLKSSEVDDIVHHQARNIPLYLFVKKEDAEGKNFYYLGRVHVIEGTVEETTMKSGEPVVTMHFNLETPVRDDIYRYIVEH